MANEVELERMVMRLIGDAESYLAMLKESEEATEETADKVLAEGAKIEAFGQQMEAAGKALTIGITAPLTAIAGVATVAFGIQEKAEFTLQGIIDANERKTAGLFDRYATFASAMQEVTTTGDEATLEMLRTAESLGATGDAATLAAKEAMGLGAALGMSAKSAARYTVMLSQGDTMMLNRYIPTLRQIEDKTEQVAEAHRVLGNMFAVAEAEAQTFVGSLQQLKNVIGDVMDEQIGGTISTIVKPFIGHLKEMVLWFGNLPAPVRIATVLIAGFAATIGPLLLSVTAFYKVLLWTEAGLKAMSIAATWASIKMYALAIATKVATVAQILFQSLGGPKAWIAIAAGITFATGAILIYTLKLREATEETEEASKAGEDYGTEVKKKTEEATAAIHMHIGAIKDIRGAWEGVEEEVSYKRYLGNRIEQEKAYIAALKDKIAEEEALIERGIPKGPRPEGAMEGMPTGRAGSIMMAGVEIDIELARAMAAEGEREVSLLEARVAEVFQTINAAQRDAGETMEERLLEIRDSFAKERLPIDLELRGASEVDLKMREVRESLSDVAEEAFSLWGGRESFFWDIRQDLLMLEEDQKRLEVKRTGAALMEQYATPFERAKKEIEDYTRMLDVLGEEEFRATYDKAVQASIERYKQAISETDKERMIPGAVQTISRGSVDEMVLRQESMMSMIVDEPSAAKQDSENLKNTAMNTSNTALGIDELVTIIRASGDTVPANLGGG